MKLERMKKKVKRRFFYTRQQVPNKVAGATGLATASKSFITRCFFDVGRKKKYSSFYFIFKRKRKQRKDTRAGCVQLYTHIKRELVKDLSTSIRRESRTLTRKEKRLTSWHFIRIKKRRHGQSQRDAFFFFSPYLITGKPYLVMDYCAVCISSFCPAYISPNKVRG